MRKFLYVNVIANCLVAAVALSPGRPAQAKPTVPTIAALGAFPVMWNFSVSPDGKHIAALESHGEDRNILVWSTDALSAKPTVIASKQMKIRSVQFVKDDVLGVTMWQPYDLHTDTTTKEFVTKFYFTDLQGSPKSWREPLPHQAGKSEVDDIENSLSAPTILDRLPNDPDHVLIVDDIGVNQGDVYKVDVHTNRAERIQRKEEHVGGYVVDLEGTLRARIKLDSDSTGAYEATEFRNPESGAWEEHFRTYAKERYREQVLAFSKDPNIAYVQSDLGRDKAAIYEYDVRARKLGNIVFEHKFFDATDLLIGRVKGPHFGDVEYFEFNGPTGSDNYFVSDWARTIDAQLSQALGVKESPQRLVDPATGDTATVPMRINRNWRLTGVSNDRSVLVVAVDSPTEPATYYMLHDGKLALLAKAYPDFDSTAVGESKLVYYKARDGLDIPAFLHTPSTELCGPGPWPAVVLPHGGPWGRDDLGFDYFMWNPMLTTRCRAVLQPQYRGSADWGRRLWLAGDAQWGLKMQDDKDDGAKWLIDQKIAIPGRIAMFGFSYGGFAAMDASVRPNGLYKCAIAGAGVSDIDRIWAKYYDNPYFKDHQEPTVKGVSPLSKADEISIPIYVFHGDRDQTVPIKQSEWFVAKAKSAGKDVTYREFKDFAHGPSWTRETYTAMLAGIDDYLTKGCAGGL